MRCNPTDKQAVPANNARKAMYEQYKDAVDNATSVFWLLSIFAIALPGALFGLVLFRGVFRNVLWWVRCSWNAVVSFESAGIMGSALPDRDDAPTFLSDAELILEAKKRGQSAKPAEKHRPGFVAEWSSGDELADDDDDPSHLIRFHRRQKKDKQRASPIAHAASDHEARGRRYRGSPEGDDADVDYDVGTRERFDRDQRVQEQIEWDNMIEQCQEHADDFYYCFEPSDYHLLSNTELDAFQTWKKAETIKRLSAVRGSTRWDEMGDDDYVGFESLGRPTVAVVKPDRPFVQKRATSDETPTTTTTADSGVVVSPKKRVSFEAYNAENPGYPKIETPRMFINGVFICHVVPVCSGFLVNKHALVDCEPGTALDIDVSGTKISVKIPEIIREVEDDLVFIRVALPGAKPVVVSSVATVSDGEYAVGMHSDGNKGFCTGTLTVSGQSGTHNLSSDLGDCGCLIVTKNPPGQKGKVLGIHNRNGGCILFTEKVLAFFRSLQPPPIIKNKLTAHSAAAQPEARRFGSGISAIIHRRRGGAGGPTAH